MDDLQLAQEMYEDAIAATRDQRIQIEEDLRFSDPSNPEQWDEAIKLKRERDPGGARPCLVMDHTGQYVANVAGQVTKNPPSIHTVPVGSGSDVKASEQIDGILRHIEYASRAQTHYGIALTSAARTGVGYLIVRPEYTDRALGYQEPRISSQADPLRVVLDPWSVQLDGSDADFGYLLTSLSEREFKRRFGNAEKVSFGQDGATRRAANDRESIIIAEQWLKEEKSRNVIVFVDAEENETSGTEDEYHAACQAAGRTLQYLRNYSDKYQCVKWRTMSGAAILETPKNADGTEALYPADAIGIVPVYGYWGVKDGRMTYCGIPRRGRNPQRSYNYHISEQHAFMASAPRSPWIAPVRAISSPGLKAMWENAAAESRAALFYDDVDAEGNPVSAPQRPNIAVNLQNHEQGAERALADLEATIGMYRANLGAPSNETSGVAIDARKEQGEASTSHFPEHLAASLGQVGRICLQMTPKLIDTKRQMRILGVDMKPGVVTVDPQAPKAYDRDQEQGVVLNPNVGTYDVRVVIGTSYSTQRSQAQTALSEVMQRNPALTPAIAPLWAMNLDFPHADKLAQVLKAMAPPQVQAVLDPDAANKPTVEQLMPKMQQMEQALQQATQQLQAIQGEATGLVQKLQEKDAQLQASEADKHIEEFNADTNRIKALADAFSKGLQVSVNADGGIDAKPLVSMHPLNKPPPMPQQVPLPDEPEQQPTEPASAGFSLPAQG